jgi:AbrB family looped-hinge helix DNA binding protein
MNPHKIFARVAENGRLSLPAGQRKLLGLEKGGRVELTVKDGILMLRPVEQVLDEIQACITDILGPSDGTEVDQFLLDRRREERAEREKD